MNTQPTNTEPLHRMSEQRDANSGDGGGADVIAVILIAPIIVSFVVLLFFLGRQIDTRATVRTASEAAAQSAARQRNPAAAEQAARRTASEMLTDPKTCAGGPIVAVDLSLFAPGGTVTVDVTCTTATNDLTAIAAPPRTFTGHSTAVIDRYRAATP